MRGFYMQPFGTRSPVFATGRGVHNVLYNVDKNIHSLEFNDNIIMLTVKINGDKKNQNAFTYYLPAVQTM